MTEPEEPGEFVGSGGFRVAGARALEVLRSAQLDKRFWRPLLWVRTAAALGARRMTADAGVRSVTFFFDGRPLPSSLHADPFALFGDGDAPPEARWLAYALVHTLSKGVRVSVSSGRGEGRRAFEFDAAGQAKKARPAPGEDTVVKVDCPVTTTLAGDPAGPWTWFEGGQGAGEARLASADAAPFAFKTPLGDVTPWEKRKSPEAAVYRDGSRRMRVVLGGGRRLGFHILGVRAGGAPMEDLALPVSVDIDDPGLTLDASLNAVVEDHAYHGCVAAGRDAAVRHGSARLEHHAKSMRLCAKLLVERPALRRGWRSGLKAREGLGREVPWSNLAVSALTGQRLPSGDSLRLFRTARFAAFLRAAALSTLRGRAFDARLPLGPALWDAPVLFSATGLPLSLADLDLDERPCAVWDGADPAPPGVGAMMVWALDSSERAFVERFPTRRARMG